MVLVAREEIGWPYKWTKRYDFTRCLVSLDIGWPFLRVFDGSEKWENVVLTPRPETGKKREAERVVE